VYAGLLTDCAVGLGWGAPPQNVAGAANFITRKSRAKTPAPIATPATGLMPSPPVSLPLLLLDPDSCPPPPAVGDGGGGGSRRAKSESPAEKLAWQIFSA
jgi:hypothetical protein